MTASSSLIMLAKQSLVCRIDVTEQPGSTFILSVLTWQWCCLIAQTIQEHQFALFRTKFREDVECFYFFLLHC